MAELDPQLKRDLYTALDMRGVTLKDWLLSEAKKFIDETKQPQLFGVASGNDRKAKASKK